MGSCSGIEWTDATWNPMTGCDRWSAGCEHCYAAAMARRLQAAGQPAYRDGFAVTLHPEALDLPRRWRRPRFVFVCSMGDLFHERVPLPFLQRVFEAMAHHDHHVYQVLTKRSQRLAELAPSLPWPAHIWAGVTVERADYQHRLADLRAVPAKLRFLSLEPLLGPLPGLDLTGIDWVVVAGESGPGARPMAEDWARSLRDRCDEVAVPFFLKQLGGWPDRRHGADALLDGRLHKAMPDVRPGRQSVDGVLPGFGQP